MVLGCARSKVPSLCPTGWPSLQARPPRTNPPGSGGGWARASSPASKASRTLRDSGVGPPVRQDCCAAQGRPGRGPCLAPLCTHRWAGGPATVTGQAVTRPAASCRTALAGDVCSVSPRINKRLETSCRVYVRVRMCVHACARAAAPSCPTWQGAGPQGCAQRAWHPAAECRVCTSMSTSCPGPTGCPGERR